jgi:hypothetical protein
MCVSSYPRISLFITPAIALYQVSSFSTVYSIILAVVPPLGKYKYDNLNTTGGSAKTVIYELADLSVIVCFTQTFLSLVTRGMNPTTTLVSVNKHFWRRCRGGNRHKIPFKQCGRIIKVR